jgi:hypothetical protein
MTTAANPFRVEAVARCLAKLDGKHVSSTEWRGEVGASYRRKAVEVIATLERYDEGLRSGGMPPPVPPLPR